MFSVWERLFSALLRSCRQAADLQEKSCSSRQARPRTTERGRWRSRGARGELQGPQGGRTAADGSSTSARRSSARARRLERVKLNRPRCFCNPSPAPAQNDKTCSSSCPRSSHSSPLLPLPLGGRGGHPSSGRQKKARTSRFWMLSHISFILSRSSGTSVPAALLPPAAWNLISLSAAWQQSL